MRSSKFLITSALLLLFTGGCASTRKQNDFDQVQKDVNDRTGVTVQWRGNPEQDSAVDQAVKSLLDSPINADQAVQIALLNNRSLQATYEDLGIAEADLVQAGLLKNPVFNVAIRVPDRSPHKTYLDFSVEDSFVDLLLMPARKKLAEVSFEQTKARVTDDVLQMAANTRSAFYSAQAAEQEMELRRTVLEAQSASFDAAEHLHAAGNTNELDLLSETAQLGRARLDLAAAEENTAEAHEHLTNLMGLWGTDTAWTVAGRLADPPEKEIDPHGLESLALRQRADLIVARDEVLIQARTLGVTDSTKFFQSADLRVEGERETDGQWRIGPTLAIPVPLFDQGQAAVARAKSALRQSEQRYYAAAVAARSQVRMARTKMFSARQRAEFYRSDVLPIQERLVNETQLEANGMLVGIFQLLEAKRDQIDSGREYIESLRDYWTARAELERAVGGKLQPTSNESPTTQMNQGVQP